MPASDVFKGFLSSSAAGCCEQSGSCKSAPFWLQVQPLLSALLQLFVKLREREGQGVDPGRSLKGSLWMVDGGWWYPFPRA